MTSRRTLYQAATTTPPNQATPAPSSDPPPVAGALIRTAGLGFLEAPGDPRTYSVAAGPITLDPARSVALTNQPGLFVGPRDIPPSANPSGGLASGVTAITPNAPAPSPSDGDPGLGLGSGGR